MQNLLIVVQLIVSAGLLNVWLLRINKATPYRGRDSKNMKEEFKAYGLPSWFMYLVGFLKLCIALLLILGIWFPVLVRPSAVVLIILMLGALSMHMKVKDPFIKSIPALLMLSLSIFIYLVS